LRKLENSQAVDDDLARRLPAYVTRGLVTNALGPWRLTRAGEIRLDVVQRERNERIALCKQHLDEAGFAIGATCRRWPAASTSMAPACEAWSGWILLIVRQRACF
jgi:hypothetical protein